jgi:2-polyprenyl-3-methyl-5-hydroxy-6-metoxy-1,4-benzoquinol methylase
MTYSGVWSLEKFPCPICESPDTRYQFDTSKRRGWRGASGGAVWRCRSCGSGFVPEPVSYGLTPSQVECDPTTGINPLWVREAEAHRLNWRRRLDLIERSVDRPGRLLDIGCYNGLFLDEARKRGWKCKGIEPDVEASRWAREQLGLDVFTGQIQELPASEAGFDVVTAFHTLEHIRDPLLVLEEVQWRLASHAVLVIETPNCGLWLRLLGRRFRYIQPDHVYYFSRRGIVHLLNRAGYRVSKIHVVGKDTSLSNLINWIGLYFSGMSKIKRLLGAKLARKTIYLNLGDIVLVEARRA